MSELIVSRYVFILFTRLKQFWKIHDTLIESKFSFKKGRAQFSKLMLKERQFISYPERSSTV